MATTTATLSVSSDIMTYPINISKTMVMNKLGTCTGLDETSGLRAKTIGKLYGGDWMLIPYLADVNITVAPNTTNVMTLEYMVFAE